MQALFVPKLTVLAQYGGTEFEGDTVVLGSGQRSKVRE